MRKAVILLIVFALISGMLPGSVFAAATAGGDEANNAKQTAAIWELGTIASVNGQNNATNTRLRTVDYISLAEYSGVSINTGYTMTNFVYDENHVYLGTSSWLGSGIPFTTAQLREKYPSGVYFRLAFRADNSRKLTADDVEISGVKFHLKGEEVPFPDLGFGMDNVASIGVWQDGAIWDGKLFALGAGGTGAVFEVKTGERIAGITLDGKDVLKPHANSVCFGSTYYADGDKYPLLYVNIYNNYALAEDRMEGTCCVYRIQETDGGFSTDLVQVIRIGFTEDLKLWKSKEGNGDVRPYGNFVVDTDRQKLYAFVMRDANKTIRFFGFDIPGLDEGTYFESYGCKLVTLYPKDIEAQFDISDYNYLQGCCYGNGMILFMEDFGGDAPLCVVDLEGQTVANIYNLGRAGVRSEPEVLCIDPADGTLYYVPADGILRIITLDDLHFDEHSYKNGLCSRCGEDGAELTEENGSVSLRIPGLGEAARVIAAFYSGERMLSCRFVTMTDGEAVFPAVDTAEVRVFVLGDDWTPLRSVIK